MISADVIMMAIFQGPGPGFHWVKELLYKLLEWIDIIVFPVSTNSKLNNCLAFIFIPYHCLLYSWISGGEGVAEKGASAWYAVGAEHATVYPIHWNPG